MEQTKFIPAPISARQKLREEIELRIQIEIREKKPDPHKLKELKKNLQALKV